MKNKIGKGTIFYIVLLIAVIVGPYFYNGTLPFQNQAKKETYSDILNDIKDKKIKHIKFSSENSLSITYKAKDKEIEKTLTKTISPYWMQDILQELKNAKIDFDYEESWNFSLLFNGILSFIMIAMMIFFMWMMLGRSFAEGKSQFNFGKSKHRLIMPHEVGVTFKDVAGAEEEKLYLQEVVEFLKNPARFNALGARVPRGILLDGPPGTGKTLLAKAVAGEANVPFFSMSGSDFVEMFVGVGASRVRDLFIDAKKKTPCIIFIDEIDAVGRRRGAGMGGGHDEREQTLNQLLVEMDGFTTAEEIIIIAATNRPDILDPALLRPGRFDHKITVNPPDLVGREAILKIHAKNKPLNSSIDLKEIAQMTPGFTGADLANLLNEAALNAAKRYAKIIEYDDISEAVFTVMVGLEKKSAIVSPKERAITAYHEAGHAIILRTVSEYQKVERVSIISAGSAGGYTAYKPYEDRYFYTKNHMLGHIMVALGGRAAEQIIFGEITTGASSDLKHCNKTARDMVTVYGMSDTLLNLYYGTDEGEVFLGRDYGHVKQFSNEVAQLIDAEVKEIIGSCYAKVLQILQDKSVFLEELSQELLRVEKIDGERFEYLYQKYTTEEQRADDVYNAAVEKLSEKVLQILEKEKEEEKDSQIAI